MCSFAINAQNTDFDRVFEACIKINAGFVGGVPDCSQLLAASETLRNQKTGPLQLKQTKGEMHPIDGHLYFSADFIKKCIQQKKIYPMAKEYAEQDRLREIESGQVLLTTILIPAGKTYTYEIAGCKGEVVVGCIAETNGLMSWQLATFGYKSKAIQTYRDNKDEKNGRSSRRVTVTSSERYKIILEITNTGKYDSSFAILAK